MSSAGPRDRQTTATGGERVTYREDGNVLAAIDTLVEQGEFENRSDALRAATRQLVDSEPGGESE